MDKYKVLVVGDVAASYFYHLPDYKISVPCPYCGERNGITRVRKSSIDVPDELMKRVGYPTVGECYRCQRKMVVGFKL